jgi:hypothetical protein
MSKSGRFFSMPESTIAIVGRLWPLAGWFPHIGLTPDAVGQTCFDVGATVPLSLTFES